MKIGRRFKGTPLWNEIKRCDGRLSGLSHMQDVSFCYGNKYYTAKFHRFFNKAAPQGQRVSYELDIIHDSTGAECPAFAKAMLEQTKWLSTFKRNVQAWADAL